MQSNHLRDTRVNGFRSLTRAGAIVSLTVLATPLAAETLEAMFADVAAQACPAIILRPDTALPALGALGFKLKNRMTLSPAWSGMEYTREGRGANSVVTSMVKTFPDATIRTCQLVSRLEQKDVDLNTLKGKLESDADIHHLDGEVTKSDKVNIGWFRRPGSNPSVTIFISTSPDRLVLSMARTDFKAAR